MGQELVSRFSWNFSVETHSFAKSALPTRDRTYESVYYVNTSEDLFKLIV